ncbi:unnamed protein product [marine sediment metagenome]|uniref:Uncharacterized protein n=1 Tax=marine sediment metagenome TaxID=412755 RepID=X1BJM9_9ZZZZ
MAWVSPTGFNDPSSKYSFEDKAYDDNINTYCRSGYNPGAAYLELTHPAIQCDKVRINVAKRKPSGEADPDILLDVYYGGAWHNIFSGKVAMKVWVEKEIGSTESVTAMRLCCDSFKGYNYFWIYEVAFNQVKMGLINGYFMQNGIKEEKFGYLMNSIEEFGYYMNI